MATHIKTTGEVEDVNPQDSKAFSLQELQDFVGGYIELVQLPTKETMVVNEEGRLRELPYNSVASSKAQRLIVGDVIVMSQVELQATNEA